MLDAGYQSGDWVMQSLRWSGAQWSDDHSMQGNNCKVSMA